MEVLGDFIPYGKEFIGTYPHLAECSQSTRSLKVADFSKLVEQNLKRTTTTTQVQTAQSYQLSSVPAPTPTQPTTPMPPFQSAIPVDEELYVQNNIVIWSRGRHIIKTFHYQLQFVEMALFAWFPVDQHEYSDSNAPSIDQIISNRKRKIALNGKESVKKKSRSTLSFTNALMEAEQQCKFTPLSGDTTTSLPPIPDTSSSGDKSNIASKRLQKAACVILKDCVKIHFIDGKHYSIHYHSPCIKLYHLTLV
ncbi:unnamed protein product [Absidia cylindrospora]